MALTIDVRNVGLVRSAHLDLRQLTLIMGPNNAGKSTLAEIVYSAIRATGQASVRGAVFSSRTLPTPVRRDLEKFMLASLVSEQSPESIIAAVRPRVVRALLETYCAQLVRNLERALGVSLNSIATRGKRRYPLQIVVQGSDPSWSARISLAGTKPRFAVTFSDHVLNGLGEDESLSFLNSWSKDNLKVELESDPSSLPSYLIRTIANAIATHIYSSFPRDAHYLPAARAGLLQSHRLVAAALLQGSARVGISALAMPSLPGVVADFLSEVLLYDEPSPSRPRARFKALEDVADNIENGILHGSILHRYDADSRYPEVSYVDAGGHEYDLNRTSSMVSELAPLVIALRRALGPDELIVIEEPESHLHPKSQALLSEQLYALSKCGVFVLLTTHSDFFLTEVNNALRSDILAGGNPIPDVSAYWVRQDEIGSTAVQLNIDEVDGIQDVSFVDVAAAQYDQQVEQQMALLEDA